MFNVGMCQRSIKNWRQFVAFFFYTGSSKKKNEEKTAENMKKKRIKSQNPQNMVISGHVTGRILAQSLHGFPFSIGGKHRKYQLPYLFE